MLRPISLRMYSLIDTLPAFARMSILYHLWVFLAPVHVNYTTSSALRSSIMSSRDLHQAQLQLIRDLQWPTLISITYLGLWSQTWTTLTSALSPTSTPPFLATKRRPPLSPQTTPSPSHRRQIPIPVLRLRAHHLHLMGQRRQHHQQVVTLTTAHLGPPRSSQTLVASSVATVPRVIHVGSPAAWPSTRSYSMRRHRQRFTSVPSPGVQANTRTDQTT